MKKPIIIGLVLILFSAISTGQNTKNYTPVNMYMLNPMLINPAFSGTKESISGNLMVGANWLDIPGAKLGQASAAGWMQTMSFDYPITPKNAVGFLIKNNTFGVNSNFVFYGHYSYQINTGAGNLSFGLRAGLNSYNRDLNKATFRDLGDPVQQLDYRRMYPNFGVGIYWYSLNYNVGFSIPDFFFPPLGSEAFDADPGNYNYTLMGGYLFSISSNLKIKPSTMLTYSIGAPLAYHLNLSFITFDDMVWLGVGYKPQGLIMLAEFQVRSYLRIGYAYEFPTGAVRQYAPWGSHEIMIRFDNTYKVGRVNNVYFW
jgi:type IX secretion system PorP/SprF family membrane protein